MNIMVGMIIGVFTGIPHSILSLLLKSTYKILKIIGLLINTLIIGLCFYLSIVSAA